MIHTREAWDDTFAILAAEGVPDRTVFHCFTGGPHEATEALGLGACLSFSGIVTFRAADDVRAAAAAARSTASWSRPMRPTSPQCRTGADRTGRPSCHWSVRPSPRSRACRSRAVAAASWANRTRLYGLPAD